MQPMTMALISGGLQAATGILKGTVSQSAAQQKYASDLAFQNANNRFSVWQAGFNARVQDLNKQHKYWQETVNYNQSKIFANSQRNVELMKEAEQARVVFETRANAGAAYALDSTALSDGYREAEMAAAVAQQQYTWRALQARASVQAMGQEGNSVDRMVNDYARQLGDQMVLEEINSGIRDRQYSRAQAGQVAQYMSRWNSQTFYNKTPVIDPVMPFAPLPTLITPPPPSRTGAPPSNAAFAAQIGGSLLGGLAQGYSTYGTLNALKKPSTKAGAGTPGSGGLAGFGGSAALLHQLLNPVTT